MVKMRQDAENLVASVRRDSEEGIMLPHGWDLKLLTSGSSRQINIGETIERYDNRIAITMLSDIILIGNNRTGSFALADTKQSLLAAALQAQVSNIADVFNAFAVPRLFALNDFPGLTKLPEIVPSGIQTPSMQEIALMLRAMGLNYAKDKELLSYLWHILGFPSMSAETVNSVYATQNDNDKKTTNDDDFVDTNQKQFEQNDQRYT